LFSVRNMFFWANWTGPNFQGFCPNLEIRGVRICREPDGQCTFRSGTKSHSRVGRSMPITPFLNGLKFDPEATRVMGVAFEMARAALRLADRDDPAVAMIANRIIALAKAGERNPDLLCERVLNDLRAPPPQA
jgi:hypothetical protein